MSSPPPPPPQVRAKSEETCCFSLCVLSLTVHQNPVNATTPPTVESDLFEALQVFLSRSEDVNCFWL